MELEEKIKTRTAVAAVVGLGYVGLPLAIEMVKSGYRVIGIDVSQAKIGKLMAGESYVKDVPHEDVAQCVESGRFTLSASYAPLQEADTISICVPTPLRKTKDPDISYVTAAVDEVVNVLTKHTLIVLESTTYPGTSEELIEHEIRTRLGYRIGEDFFVCFSPERVDPGNPSYHTKNTPKVIGGITPRCTEIGSMLYRNIVDTVIPVSSTRVAEMVKLLENTFRSVNIALVNELSLMCERMGINVWEVIDAAATKPFGYMPFYPGPGIGGHCIPLDPVYLSWKAKTYDFYTRFIELASDVNGNMPRFVVQEISDLLNSRKKSVNGANILMLGVAYKRDIDDVRESPALEIYHLLRDKGAEVAYYDPYVPRFADKHGNELHSVELSEGALAQADLVMIATDHRCIDYRWVAVHAPLVFDARNATRGICGDHIYLLGGQRSAGDRMQGRAEVAYV
ncbi:nucleotide sugar dehydrogenase [Paenibacillus sp. MSJ-34]|uniref:nucleotide sugar dehydrogenase n=1 Tax=Paenibacillus sp. MSJ-34 TaxID=2841529 RepID=UPI001C112D1E|nr:nucleotide sugar dehydrogenase [Paenibacillus sp. MSJ-34]MBU5443469.1 nucleotide sugar dehydrogenase [Paenibacillus sp. MSJ-34]